MYSGILGLYRSSRFVLCALLLTFLYAFHYILYLSFCSIFSIAVSHVRYLLCRRSCGSLVRERSFVFDARRSGTRGAQVEATTRGGRRPGVGGSRAGHADRVRAALAFPVAFRVMGPDPDKLVDIAAQVRDVMQSQPPNENDQYRLGRARAHASLALDQDRLQSIGLTSSDVAQQLQFLLSGIPITDVREDIRSCR